MTKTELFTTAWNTARNAANLFGGKARTYFAMALKAAYAALTAPKTVIRTFNAHSGKAWVARVTGRDQKFGFEREFLGKRDVSTARSNIYRVLDIAVDLVEGAVYEWSCQESARRNERGFWIVRGGKLTAATQADVLAAL